MIEDIAERLSDAVVARVLAVMRAEGLIPEPGAAGAWLDAQQVAQRLGVSREWVYEHALELGAVRIGSGPRPRLRFPREMLARSTSRDRRSEKQKNRGRNRPDGLIPIYDG